MQGNQEKGSEDACQCLSWEGQLQARQRRESLDCHSCDDATRHHWSLQPPFWYILPEKVLIIPELLKCESECLLSVQTSGVLKVHSFHKCSPWFSSQYPHIRWAPRTLTLTLATSVALADALGLVIFCYPMESCRHLQVPEPKHNDTRPSIELTRCDWGRLIRSTTAEPTQRKRNFQSTHRSIKCNKHLLL